jgi:hypothetical protein
MLQEVRKAYREEILQRFYSRIGINSQCDTYVCRNLAVQNGLGPFTANKVLDAALQAWHQSIKRGRPPRFVAGPEKVQDTLTVQITEAGGCPVTAIFSGKRKDVAIEYPQRGFRKRSYAPFRFRAGSAKDQLYVAGTVQLDREPPAGAHVTLVRLARKMVGPDYRYTVQLLLKLPEPIHVDPQGGRKPLAALHFGWNAAEAGRRLAGLSDNGDVWDASILSLPSSIEEDLQRATEIQSDRDRGRDVIMLRLKKELVMPELPEEDPLWALWERIRRLPAQYVSANRLHYLARLLREREALPDWFEDWRKAGKRSWQQQVHLARSARNRRRTLYRKIALDLARAYEVIVLEMPDLKKLVEDRGETSGGDASLPSKAQAGRAVVALHSLESAIHWAACKCDTVILRLSGEETVRTCAVCGGLSMRQDPEDGQILHCLDCEAGLDRKKNGAANAWRAASAERESLVTAYWEAVTQRRDDAATRRADRSARMQAARHKARTTTGRTAEKVE